MNLMLLVATAGWGTSVSLALVLGRRRAAARLRGDRLAGVIHELRGPLQAAALILAAAERLAGAAAAPALGALDLELGRLRLAVGDLGMAEAPVRARRAGRAAAPTPVATATARETCDVAALVEDLAAGWRVVAGVQGRELRVTRPACALPVAAGPPRLAQALGNLVGNALEHGDGVIDVRLELTSGGVVRCEVRDEGTGLPAPVGALVARAPDPRRPRGRGLGIAAAIAADAGGALLSAPSASGARLVLHLPRAAASGPRAAAAAAAAKA